MPGIAWAQGTEPGALKLGSGSARDRQWLAVSVRGQLEGGTPGASSVGQGGSKEAVSPQRPAADAPGRRCGSWHLEPFGPPCPPVPSQTALLPLGEHLVLGGAAARDPVGSPIRSWCLTPLGPHGELPGGGKPRPAPTALQNNPSAVRPGACGCPGVPCPRLSLSTALAPASAPEPVTHLLRSQSCTALSLESFQEPARTSHQDPAGVPWPLTCSPPPLVAFLSSFLIPIPPHFH